MDSLNNLCFILVSITLSVQVEEVIDILRDFLGFSILLEKSSKDSLSPHPKDLGGHSCVSGTSSLTRSLMSTYSLSNNQVSI